MRNADSPNSRQVTLCNYSIASSNYWEPGKAALVMDIMGARMKSDEYFTVAHYPAGTLKMIDNLLVEGKLRFNHEFVIFHLGTNVVMDFERSDIIGKVIRLAKTTREKYQHIKIYFSTLVPRPPDHSLTDRAIIRYNDALKTGVNVANRRYAPVRHISNHQLFVHSDTSFKEEMYHKRELRFLKKGVKTFKDNIRAMLRLR